MTWEADVTSVEDGAPREAIEIRYGLVVHRLATGSRDVVVGGNKYTASTVARGAIAVSFAGSGAELSLQLPSSHAFCQRWLGQTSPPRNVAITIRQQQQNSGETETIWRGVLSSCSASGHVVTFKGLASSAYVLQRQLSTVTVSRSCPHILYDSNCRVARASFRVSTTVASHDGRTVTVASMSGNPSQWAQFGELVHLPSGERMTIGDQTGTQLTLQLPIVGLQNGDAVQVFAGCAHDITTCSTKFANQVNYGGSPRSPRDNPMIPGKNLGIIVQE